MTALPLQFKGNDSWQTQGLTGDEIIEVMPDPAFMPQSDAVVTIRRGGGSVCKIAMTLCIDTPIEVDRVHQN